MSQHQGTFNSKESRMKVDSYSKSVFILALQRFLVILPSVSTWSSLRHSVRKIGNLVNLDRENSLHDSLFGPTVIINLTYL